MTWYESKAVHIDDDYVVFYKSPMDPLSKADHVAIDKAINNQVAIVSKRNFDHQRLHQEAEKEFDKNFLYKMGIKE